MEEFGTNAPRDDIYSKVVRAGKRTYFFDVKSTRSNELYLTITESKRRFNQQTGKFYYEKHKLFLYQEDFDKFKEALSESFSAIDRLQGEILKESPPAEQESLEKETKEDEKKADDISFEDLGDTKEEEDDSSSGEESTDEPKE